VDERSVAILREHGKAAIEGMTDAQFLEFLIFWIEVDTCDRDNLEAITERLRQMLRNCYPS